MSFQFNDYSSFRPHNHKSQREYHRKKNQQVVYVEKTPKNDEKTEVYHNKDNKKLNFYENSYEKTKFNSKKYKENNYIYYEPKMLSNDVFKVAENPEKSSNIQETNCENERKFLDFQPTIESAPSENFRVDREEKISIAGSIQIIESTKKK